ncbi:hypothetical protein [Salinisphaera orenii]|uniref:hypothetical protein n=1 Tax=Salinisphaera orenii TaxID=856731 RepID=UPI000DBE5A9B
MARTLLLVIAVTALAIGLRRATNLVARDRRRRKARAKPRFLATQRCARCGTHLAPGVQKAHTDNAVCDVPGCRARLAKHHDHE